MSRGADRIPGALAGLSERLETRSGVGAAPIEDSAQRSDNQPNTGLLIVNADDWGRSRENNERIMECFLRGAISSVSAMVYMEDSERAAAIAQERGIAAGLHLNFTTPFSVPGCPARLVDHQRRLARYLLRHRFAQVAFHPGLIRSFEYVVAAQLGEFRRLYGAEPDRLDGHHHMHLCANVIWQGLLPPGTLVRRNFSLQPGEKGIGNRLYRRFMDDRLARHHRLADYFFSLAPLEPMDRLRRIFSLARKSIVEVETHPVNAEEFRFLVGGDLFRLACGVPFASGDGTSRCGSPQRRPNRQ